MNKDGEILFFFEKVDKFSFEEKKYREWIRMIIKSEGSVPGFLNLIFTNDYVLRKLNEKYLKESHYTDVIAFEYSKNEDDRVSGDIFISVHRVRDNAIELGETFEREMQRVISHGILHLLEYDDKTEDHKKKMKEKEDLYIEKYCCL